MDVKLIAGLTATLEELLRELDHGDVVHDVEDDFVHGGRYRAVRKDWAIALVSSTRLLAKALDVEHEVQHIHPDHAGFAWPESSPPAKNVYVRIARNLVAVARRLLQAVEPASAMP